MCSSPPASKIATSFWTDIHKRTLELTKKIYSMSKDKKKPEQNDRRGAIKIKSNTKLAGLVTHRKESNNTKETLALL